MSKQVAKCMAASDAHAASAKGLGLGAKAGPRVVRAAGTAPADVRDSGEGVGFHWVVWLVRLLSHHIWGSHHEC